MESSSISYEQAPKAFPTLKEARISRDRLVLEKTIKDDSNVRPGFGIRDKSKALAIAGDNILKKINELLEARGAPKIEKVEKSPKKEGVTPEQSVDFIMKGVAALFHRYAKSNPDKDPEKLIEDFMGLVKKGASAGFENAYNSLKSIGAFDIEGVEDAVNSTMKLLGERLNAFEQKLKESYGLTQPPVEEEVRNITKASITALGEGHLDIAA